MVIMPDGKALAKEMEGELPVFCYVDKPLKQLLSKQGMSVNERTRFEITEVRYMDEVGGITCVIKYPDGGGVLAVSATQVQFSDEGAIYDKINKYRAARIRWLQQEERKDKMLGRSGRINYVESNKDGSVRYGVDDGTEIVSFPNVIDKAETYAKTSRNSPCPCGSGKKYKRCCG